MGIIDCDTHPVLPEGLTSLVPFMPKVLAERFGQPNIGGRERESVARPGFRYKHPSKTFVIPDATPPSGARAGSDQAYFIKDYLEGRGLDACVLLPIEPINAWTDPVLVAGFVRAMNDYYAETWLPVDRRFNLAVVVYPQDPAGSAAEIRRMAKVDGVVGVFMPLLNIRMGSAYYDPIYEAAQECGLPVVIHPFGPEGIYQGAPAFAGGIPTTYTERMVSYAEIGMASVTSLVFEGTLEKFPGLTVVFAENGFTWAVPLMWRMDMDWQRLRIETPWVRKRPSEYVVERLRFTTQPLEEPEPGQMQAMLDWLHAEKTILFASDYPHWDIDDPHHVLTFLKTSLRERIFRTNAIETFGRLRVASPVAG
jgi:uncharacterized protein